MSEATIEVLTGPAFFTGIIAGATALVIGWLAYLLFNEWKRPSRAGWLVVTVAAAELEQQQISGLDGDRR